MCRSSDTGLLQLAVQLGSCLLGLYTGEVGGFTKIFKCRLFINLGINWKNSPQKFREYLPLCSRNYLQNSLPFEEYDAESASLWSPENKRDRESQPFVPRLPATIALRNLLKRLGTPSSFLPPGVRRELGVPVRAKTVKAPCRI